MNDMDDIAAEMRILDYLQGRLSEAERLQVDDLRRSSPAFDARFNEVRRVWKVLDERVVPEIDHSLKNNFQAMLKTFELEQEHKKVYSPAHTWRSLTDLLDYKPKYNWAYAILLVAFGASFAWLFLQPRSYPNAGLSQEMIGKKQATMLSMLEDPAAVERMRAISYTSEPGVADGKVVKALLVTLNTDPDENVRLVTLNALTQLADNPKVRAGLVSSIVKQDSELMQVALAEAMLHLQEKRAVKSFKKLLSGQNMTNDMIRKKLEQTVKKLETI